MRETTAEIWIGPDQTTDFMGTSGGINATWLMLLRENSRPAWMLIPGNLHDSEPPNHQSPRVWVPSRDRSLEDALVMFAVCGAEDPSVIAMVRQFVAADSLDAIDVGVLFPDGLPDQIYEISYQALRNWHVIVSAGEYSLIARQMESLRSFTGLSIEARTTFFRADPLTGNAP